MATASPRRWSRIRRRVLQPTPTSIHFQEALRLCRDYHEDQQHPSQTDEEMSLSGDMDSISLGTPTTIPTTTNTTTTTTTHSRRRRNSRRNRNNNEHHPTITPPQGQQQQQQQHQQQHHLLLPDSRTPSPQDDSLLEETGQGTKQSSSSNNISSMRVKSCDKSPGGAHVHWADQSQQDLVKETPRKRYQRRPSLAEPDPLKSILKPLQ